MIGPQRRTGEYGDPPVLVYNPGRLRPMWSRNYMTRDIFKVVITLRWDAATAATRVAPIYTKPYAALGRERRTRAG